MSDEVYLMIVLGCIVLVIAIAIGGAMVYRKNQPKIEADLAKVQDIKSKL